jgi:acetyl-CoA carboxylase carboxyl transferase subunit beta
MSLKDWFAAKRNTATATLDPASMNARLSDDEICKLWTQCFSCSANLPTKALLAHMHVCPECGYHFRIGAKRRLAQLADAFEEMDADLSPADPLLFEDTEPYVKRIADAHKKSKLNDAIITGIATIGHVKAGLGVMDFGYMGGSMGSVVGEKITRLAERCLTEGLPLIIISSSGGARMQEGTFSLMQMVKTGTILSRLHEAGLLFISVLSEPTYGGVTASYAMLGDIIIAEEGARIGFAGRRVIEQTIHQKLPADFQTANYLMQYGQLDRISTRHDLKALLEKLIVLHQPPMASVA